MERREQYRLIRYDYYHAGRILHLMGNFHSAGIMLGYAGETTMKAGLMEVTPEKEWGKNIFQSHDVQKILKRCQELNLFEDVRVSMDFLIHIDNNFCRYPSQMIKVGKRAEEQSIALGNSSDWVYYYDDLIVQLDRILLEMTRDPMISMIYHALRTLETRYAQDILNRNAFALLNFDDFATWVRQNMPERDDLRELVENNLAKGATYYWDTNVNSDVSRGELEQIAQMYSAKSFKLPMWRDKGVYIEAVIP